MERLRGLAGAVPNACIPCCEGDGGNGIDDVIHDADLSYANWMSDVSNRLWSIQLVSSDPVLGLKRALRGRAAEKSGTSARALAAVLASGALFTEHSWAPSRRCTRAGRVTSRCNPLRD